jgi:hypothetical protein
MGLGDAELTAIVRHHHERLDGTGYPDRLAGDTIPLGARIIAVADTFDAITSARPYRGASAHKKAIDILATEAGTQLDPAAVRAFDSCYAGRRPVALWAGLTNALQRLAWWLTGGLTAASTASVAPLIAVAAASGAISAANPTHARAMRSSRVTTAAPTTRWPGRLYISDREVGPAASSQSVAVRSPTHRRKQGAAGAHNRGASTARGGARGGGPTDSGAGGGSSQSSAGGSNANAAGSSTTAGSPTPSSSGAGGETGGPGNGGNGGTGATVGGTSVSTGATGTGATVGGTSVTTGATGTGATVGGTSVTTGATGTGATVGGTSVTTGATGTGATVGGTSVTIGGTGGVG